MRSSARFLLFALLVAPAHVLFVPAARPLIAARSFCAAFPVLRAPVLRARPILAIADEDDPYRMLGITEDASYDEILGSFDELSDQYEGDTARLSSLEAAKDKVVNNMLQRRMAGAQAVYAGSLAAEDRKPEPKTPKWVLANQFRKRVVLVPSPKYALQVIALMGGLALAAWLAPSTASTTSIVNTVSGMGFMYNRGEADIPRDDFGQIGEIRPMKPKPFALTCTITALVWLIATLRTKAMLAAMGGRPPRALELILRTTFVSLGLMIPALFVRVHGVFPHD